MDKEKENDLERLFKASCKFVLGTTDFNHFPNSDLPEFAFIGRSNVGKSSLINALVNQKSLARVSVTPGRTQQVNFFDLGGKFMLIDLPGYGFAKAPKNLVKAWERMSLGYLKNRKNLKLLFLLIDSRHGFKKSDLEFMAQLNNFGINYQIVLTKVDKSNNELIKSIINFITINVSLNPAMLQDVIITSSKNKKGLNFLRASIYDRLN